MSSACLEKYGFATGQLSGLSAQGGSENEGMDERSPPRAPGDTNPAGAGLPGPTGRSARAEGVQETSTKKERVALPGHNLGGNAPSRSCPSSAGLCVLGAGPSPPRPSHLTASLRAGPAAETTLVTPLGPLRPGGRPDGAPAQGRPRPQPGPAPRGGAPGGGGAGAGPVGGRSHVGKHAHVERRLSGEGGAGARPAEGCWPAAARPTPAPEAGAEQSGRQRPGAGRGPRAPHGASAPPFRSVRPSSGEHRGRARASGTC